MAIGWTFLLLGVVVAQAYRSFDPQWFYVHMTLQLLGLAQILAAFILVFVALDGKRTDFTAHLAMGVTATALALTQLAALVRPRHDARFRRPWEFGHRWVGRSAVLLVS